MSQKALAPDAFHLAPDAITDADGLIVGYKHPLEDAEQDSARWRRALWLNWQLSRGAQPGTRLHAKRVRCFDAAYEAGCMGRTAEEREAIVARATQERVEDLRAEAQSVSDLLAKDLSANMRHAVELQARSLWRRFDDAVAKLEGVTA